MRFWGLALMVLGLSLAAGAEAHYNTGHLIIQAAAGGGLFIFGLSIAKHAPHAE
jgi:hypothetical protein